MPLVRFGKAAVPPPMTEAQLRARKVNPSYSTGNLVRVAGGRHQAEAEMIQGLLLEEGVPSLLRRSAGFDVPDFLAAGPRDVMVPSAGVDAAREVLLESDLLPTPPPDRSESAPRHAARLFGALAAGGVVSALACWALLQSVG